VAQERSGRVVTTYSLRRDRISSSLRSRACHAGIAGNGIARTLHLASEFSGLDALKPSEKLRYRKLRRLTRMRRSSSLLKTTPLPQAGHVRSGSRRGIDHQHSQMFSYFSPETRTWVYLIPIRTL